MEAKAMQKIYWVGHYPPDDEYSAFEKYEDAQDIAFTMAFDDDNSIIAIWDMTDNSGEILALITAGIEFTP
jgi:hypothetical protein